MEIQDTKTVWVAWTNTDRSEGRGYDVPYAICEMSATAIRLGKGKGVQGSDCRVSESVAVRVAGQWLVPWEIQKGTKEDSIFQKNIDAKKVVLQKAKEAGLTDEELKLLSTK